MIPTPLVHPEPPDTALRIERGLGIIASLMEIRRREDEQKREQAEQERLASMNLWRRKEA